MKTNGAAIQNSLENMVESLRMAFVVVVGGEVRQSHCRRLEQAFELRQLIWVPMREADASPRRFASVIQQDGVSFVVGLHGLLRHQHARDLRGMCRRLQIPYLACWRSPNPHRIVAAIVQQRLVEAIRGRLSWCETT